MRRSGVFLASFVLLFLGTHSTPAVEPIECQYFQVVDPCGRQLLIFGVGSYGIGHSIPLDGGEAGQHAPGGVDFATVPGFGEKHSFVAQGPFLRVINHELDEPLRTVNLSLVFGMPELSLLRVHAARPVEIDGEFRYLLYVIGSKAAEPWLLVLDQEAFLVGEPLPGSHPLASGPLCLGGEECAGVGVDISANYPPTGLGVQEAYASVMAEVDGVTRQRFYRITLFEGIAFEAQLAPWNEEDQPFGGSMPLALGVDYDSFGVRPHGVFQTSAVAANLYTGEASCPLTGDPVDLEIAGPIAGNDPGDSAYYYFVTSHDPGGPDQVLGFPAGECPGGSPASIELPAGEDARAMAIDSETSLSPWIYTVGSPGVSAVRLAFISAGRGTQIELLESLEIPVEGACPFEISMRDPSYQACSDGILQVPKPPPVRCEEDPDDPACKEPEKNSPIDFGQK